MDKQTILEVAATPIQKPPAFASHKKSNRPQMAREVDLFNAVHPAIGDDDRWYSNKSRDIPSQQKARCYKLLLSLTPILMGS